MSDTYKQEKNYDSTPETEEDNAWEWHSQWDGGNTWLWGVILVVGGGLLLAQNMLDFRIIYLHNWWAVFMLVPGLQMLEQGWRAAKRNGKSSSVARRRTLGGFLMVGLALSFLLNVAIQVVGPIFLIVFGLYLLMSRN